jgi:hypothetical protein
VQQIGSDSERSSTTTKKRTAEPNPQLKKMPYHANSVAVPVRLGADTVRNVLNVVKQQPVGKPKAAIGRNSISIRVQTDTFVFQNRRSWGQKRRKNLANLAKGYHR